MTTHDPLLWGLFILGILAVLALDLGVFHRDAHTPGFREALRWTLVWSTLAVGFGVWIGIRFGTDSMLEYYTGWVIEQSLSFDNVFVFVLVFQALHVPKQLQHRVLFWGVLTAIGLRAAMILGGVRLIESFHWVLYVFGGFLLLTGAKLLRARAQPLRPEDSWLLRFVRKHLRVAELHGRRFFVRAHGRLRPTPLLVALLMVEVSDIVFALDSIPAIFAITRDPFLVFSANVFAILGLRSLFFVLAGMVDRFRHLRFGLAIVLVFVGLKLLLLDVVDVPSLLSLGLILAILGASIALSRRP